MAQRSRLAALIAPAVLAFTTMASAATTIHLTGTVKSSTGTAISNADVRLISEAIGVQSASDGAFILEKNVATVEMTTLPGNVAAIASHGTVRLALAQSMPVSYRIFGLNGRQVHSVDAGILAQGFQTLAIPQTLAEGVYIISIRQGSQNISLRYLHDGVSSAPSSIQNRTATVAKASTRAGVVDTIEVSASGYSTAKYPITSYIDSNISVALNPIVEGAYPCLKSLKIGFADEGKTGKRTPKLTMGDTLPITLFLENRGTENALSVSCSLWTNDADVKIVTAKSGYNNITVGTKSENFTPYIFTVPLEKIVGKKTTIHALITDSWGGSWNDSITVDFNHLIQFNTMSVQQMLIDDDSIPDSQGNNNHVLDNGEKIEFTPKVIYSGADSISSATGRLYIMGGLDPNVSAIVDPANASWSYGTIKPNTGKLPAYDFVFTLPSYGIATDSLPVWVVMNGVEKGDDVVRVVEIKLPTDYRKINLTAVNGTISKLPNKEWYKIGDVVSLTATPWYGFSFAGWSGDVSGSNFTTTITVDANENVTANFEGSTYSLSVNGSNGTVSVSPAKSSYNHGDTVTLTAIPTDTTYHFASWSGDATGTVASTQVIMNGDKAVTAFFEKDFSLAITATDGTVSRSPDKQFYNPGDTVILTATPNSNLYFNGWSGDAVGMTNPKVIVMDSDKFVTAGFGDISSVVGTWDLNYNWRSLSTITFNADHTFLSESGYVGTWSLSGSSITWVYSSGTTYTGIKNGTSMSGTMTSYSGSTGTWDATKQ